MAGEVGDLKSRLVLLTASLEASVKRAETVMTRFGATTSKAVGKDTVAATKKARQQISNFVWTATSGIKAVSRVVYGILISQTFYRLVRVIQDATRQLTNFSLQLERSAIAFKYLLGGTEKLAKGMMAAIEDLAALTPYTYQTAENAARTLLALGFMPKQILPTLRLMSDLSAATGGEADQMESLAYAFGKVMAMGKMTTRELRLFVSARIPIYQILREQLGLTEKDFEKLRISADVALPAIIRGIMKYKGASEEMEKTTSGLISSIQDYTLFIAKDMLQGIFEAFRGVLTRIRRFLQILREVYKKEGFAGVIKLLFPLEMRQTVIILIDSFKKLGIAIVGLIKSLGPMLRTALEFFAKMLVYILPPLINLIELISDLAQRASRSSRAIKLLVAVIGTLWIATIVAGFVGMLQKAIFGLGIAAGVSKLLHGLAAAIRAVYVAASSHPIAAIITVIAGAIVYLAMTSEWGTRMLDRFQGAIARFFGIRTSIDAITTTVEEGADAFADYELSMEDMIRSFSDMGDEVEETGDEIKKFLASFDEVYTIPDKVDKALGKIDFEPFLPEFPIVPEAQPWEIAQIVPIAMEEVETAWDRFKDWFKKWIIDFGFIAIPLDWLWNLLFGETVTETWRRLRKWVLDLPIWDKEWWANLWDKVAGWFEQLKWLDKEWWKEKWSVVSEWFEGLKVFDADWWRDMWDDTGIPKWSVWKKSFWEGLWSDTSGWFDDLKIFNADWWRDIWDDTGIPKWSIWDKTWWEGLWKDAFKWFSDLKIFDADWWKDMMDYTGIKDWKIWDKEWWKDLWSDVSDWLGELPDEFIRVWEDIKEGLKKPLNGIIDLLNDLLKGFGEVVNFIVDGINKLGTLRKPLTGTEYSLGKLDKITVPEISKLEHGGIINREQIVKVVERGVPEAVTPLTVEALRPWAKAIVAEMQMAGGYGEPSPTPIYVGTLIADDAGLRELERRQYVIREAEKARRGI